MRSFIASLFRYSVTILGGMGVAQLGMWMGGEMTAVIWLTVLCILFSFLLYVEKVEPNAHQNTKRITVMMFVLLWPFTLLVLIARAGQAAILASK